MKNDMKKIEEKMLFFLLLLCTMSVGSHAAEVPLVGNAIGRNYLSLNGDWNYIVDVQEEGYYNYRMKEDKWGFFVNEKPSNPEDLVEYDFDTSPVMKVPGDWNTQDDRLFFYEGCVWFKKDFEYRKKEGHRAVLYFGAVNYEAIVYVNGKKVGSHVGGFTPFNFDITEEVSDGKNFVIVKVDNKRRAENVPTLIFDWWNYGGITRDVMVLDVPERYVENYKFCLDKADAEKVRFSLQMNAAGAGDRVRLDIPELKVVKDFVTDESGRVEAEMDIAPELWSPENPKLYKVSISCNGEKIEDEVGFRTVEAKGKQILLNGKPVFLRGISIHEEKAYGGGRANGPEDARVLLGWAKDLGCNFVRLAHYPHNEWAVREAERMGILVWSEIPCYWTIAWTDPDTYANASGQLRDMVKRDQNRANVIIWSIANETPHSPERDDFLRRLALEAKKLDDMRLVSMAMEVTSADNYVNTLKDNMHEYVDVVSFNQYVGWYRDVNDASRMTWVIPYDKPVIVSEWGGGAKYGLHGAENQRWTEEFQRRLYEENTKMLDRIEGLAGTTPWILKDFRSPRRVLNGVQDYYNRKGVVSENGERKEAFEVLKEWYGTKR